MQYQALKRRRGYYGVWGIVLRRWGRDKVVGIGSLLYTLAQLLALPWRLATYQPTHQQVAAKLMGGSS